MAPVAALGVPAPPLTDPGWWLFALAVPLAGLLGWWAGRRDDPHPVFGAVIGPLLLVAVSLSIRPLLSDVDHRAVAVSLGSAVVWSLIVASGSVSALVGARIGRRRADSRR